MTNHNKIKTAIRRRGKQERFGSLNPFCVLCGNGTIETLAAVRLDRLQPRLSPARLNELHHVVGQHHDPNLVVPLCRNCHCMVTEGLAQADVSMRPESEPRERVAVMLDALAVFLEFLVNSLRQWAGYLRKSITAGVSNEQ
jgi:hypothetical protein